jgi:hypothetical protein
MWNPTGTINMSFGGNVGIGTTSPTAKLDVLGTTQFGRFNLNSPSVFHTNNTSSTPAITAFKNTEDGAANVLLIQSFFGGASVVDVASIKANGAATFSSSVTAGDLLSTSYGTARIQVTSTQNSANAGYRFGAKDSGGTAKNAGIYYVAGTTTANTFVSIAANDNDYQFNVLANGNVGIGTTSPLSISGFTALEVKGTSAGTVCVSSGGGSAFGRIYTAGSTVIVGTSTNHPLILDTNDTERMRITSGGQLMVNTTLGLGGTIVVANRSGNAGINVFDAQGNGSLVQFYNSGAVQIGSITTDGSSTAYNTTSDYRLKQDLKDYSGLSLVNNIKTYDYEWKSDKTRMYGVIAHELQEIIPYAIHGEKDAEEMQSVDYSKLVPVLVKAIQELTEKVKQLENK